MNLPYMKRSIISTLLLIQAPVYALNPVNGWYGGVFLGVSSATSSTLNFEPAITFTGPNVSLSAQTVKATRSVLGDVGGQIGYRFCDRYRLEGEVMYNNNPFNYLKVENITLSNTYNTAYNLTPPNSIKYGNIESSADAHIQGDTNTGAFMFNAYYDFFVPSNDGYSNVVPFVGLGIGYSYVQNALQFYRRSNPDTTVTESNQSREIISALQTRTTYAGQIMGGLSYFMDDFTWFSADVRYFATGSSDPSTEYTYITPTAVYVKHSNTNLFGKSTQLLSANVTFNGVFNFG
ncbi:MAG: hypothetical protein Q8R24_06100 [Legionellaceae bacterium]|nr:hypothetical protein [Legionellaceae bacterium]